MIFRKLFRPLLDGGEGGGGGTAVLPEWITATFSEDVRKDPELAPLFNPDEKGNPPDMSKYKNPVDFIKSYRNQAKIVGAKGVIVPADFEKATPEEMEKYYNGIGRPATSKDYKFSDVKDLHPALKMDEKSGEGFREFLWKSGMPAKQADAVNQYATTYLSNMLKESDKAAAEYQAKSIAELKAEWGDKYQENLDGATKLVKAVLGDKAADLGPLENTPSGLRFLAKLKSVISEDSIAKITGGGGSQMPDQEAAVKEITEIMADAKGGKKHPMNDEKHADHGKWIGTEGLWTQLHQRAYKPQA